MSSEITEARVKQYSANVFHLSQQKGSRLRGLVRQEMQKGVSAFYDRIGQTAAIKKVGRHSDTPQIDSAHSRRRVTLQDYVWADLIDEEDIARILMDPKGPYTQAAMWAFGRSMDDVIIDAALGTAYSGEEGSTSVSMPNTQKLAATDGSSAGTDLNLDALRRTKEKFMANDVDESIPLYFVCTSSQISALLNEEELTSADYNTVRALVRGEIDTFMGFKFIRTERLNTRDGALSFTYADGGVGSGSGDADGYRRCFAFAADGLLLATARGVKARVSERDDKNYATQIHVSMSIGATRLEEDKVVEVLCNEG